MLMLVWELVIFYTPQFVEAPGDEAQSNPWVTIDRRGNLKYGLLVGTKSESGLHNLVPHSIG